jgi:hypothetical protein
MIWGKSIFPHFHVNAPMPFGVREPKPETVPADIATAIEALHHHAFMQGALSPGTAPGNEAERKAYAARAALSAVILKHLRGEA